MTVEWTLRWHASTSARTCLRRGGTRRSGAQSGSSQTDGCVILLCASCALLPVAHSMLAYRGSGMQAIDAISQVLALCGTTPEDVESIRIADELGDRVQCQSCSCIKNVRSVVCVWVYLPFDPSVHASTRTDTASVTLTAASPWRTLLSALPSSMA